MAGPGAWYAAALRASRARDGLPDPKAPQPDSTPAGSADPPPAPTMQVPTAPVSPSQTAPVSPSQPDRQVGPPEQTAYGDPSPIRHGGSRRAPRFIGGRALHPVQLRIVATIAVAAGILLIWWVLAERPTTSAVDTSVDVSAGPSEQTKSTAPGSKGTGAKEGEVIVDVAGKVKRPGIVVLPGGSRVHQAIEKAGGLKGRVDTTGLNLARVLNDGEQVLVGIGPASPGGANSSGGAGDKGSGTGLVNLNSATSEQLQELPGVGPVTAEAIISWRTDNGPFMKVEDLLEVTGIGDKTLADLRDLVTI